MDVFLPNSEIDGVAKEGYSDGEFIFDLPTLTQTLDRSTYFCSPRIFDHIDQLHSFDFESNAINPSDSKIVVMPLDNFPNFASKSRNKPTLKARALKRPYEESSGTGSDLDQLTVENVDLDVSQGETSVKRVKSCPENVEDYIFNTGGGASLSCPSSFHPTGIPSVSRAISENNPGKRHSFIVKGKEMRAFFKLTGMMLLVVEYITIQ